MRSVNTKYLFDLLNGWFQMVKRGLARYPYTNREIANGLVLVGCADELSKSDRVLLAEYASAHLVHRLEEDAFFDRKFFRFKADFLEKITGHDFTISKPNFHKDRKAPLQIILEKAPASGHPSPRDKHLTSMNSCAGSSRQHPGVTIYSRIPTIK